MEFFEGFPSSPSLAPLPASTVAYRAVQPSYKFGGAFVPKFREELAINFVNDAMYLAYSEIPEQHFVTGEDSFFFAKPDAIGRFSFGVADGVGGWQEFKMPNGDKIDPSIISKFLMQSAKAAFLGLAPLVDLKPRAVMTHVYDQMITNPGITGGSSTACLLSIGPEGEELVLEYSNLGDSGFLLINELNEIVTQSIFQNHEGNNAPFQLSVVPPHLADSGFVQDTPAAAASGSVSLEDSDLIIVASDGVFDNLTTDRISELIVQWRESGNPIEQLSINIVDAARTISRTPFGKPDDISCLVVEVSIPSDDLDASE